MKQIIIMIIILIIIFGGAKYTQDFLNNSSDKLVEKLEMLKEKIESEKIKQEEKTKIAKEIYEEWENTNEKWSVIVLHDEIDLIETALIRMKSKIETGDAYDSMEDLNTSIFLLKHIKEKEKTSLKNIF